MTLNSKCFSETFENYHFFYFRFLLYSAIAFCFCFLAAVGHFMYMEYNHQELGTKTLAMIIIGIMLIFGVTFLLLIIFLYTPKTDKGYGQY